MASKKSSILSRRKLRKLKRDPRLYFTDALRNRAGAMTDLAIRATTRLPMKGFLPAERRYSVVSAVYNVEPYLDRFFESLLKQTTALKHIEIIVVDDGSTDGSAAVIERWRRKYPDNIISLHKENGGQASARNLGLVHATGEWVTFIDPDDFVGQRYLEHIDRFLSEHEELDLALLCTKWVFFHERGKRYAENHPLNYRFANGSYATLQDERSDFMASSASTSFFRTDLLARHGLVFDEEIRPNFEDGHFTGRYLLYTRDKHVGMVADALYYYRKRDDGSSTSDLGWSNPSRFDAVLTRGYLALLREGEAMYGRAPRSVQRLVLYDLSWYFTKVIDNAASVAFLTAAQREGFRERVRAVMEHIDESTIADFSLAGFWFFHKVGLLGLYKDSAPEQQFGYVKSYDRAKRLVEVAFFSHDPEPLARFRVDGRDVIPSFAKVRTHEFLADTFAHQHLAWVRMPRGYSRLTLDVDGQQATLKAGRAAGDGLTFATIRRAVDADRSPVRPDVQTLPLRKAARLPEVVARYRDAWLLIDRDTQADDNAEHLYRYLLENRPDINAHFVLSRSSHDWPRLERDGFRLVEFGSREHHLLLLNAKHVVSSHADSFVLRLLDSRWYGDMLSYRFTFLQHGVIRDDISKWLNAKPISLFVTSSPREHESVAGDFTPYRYGRLQTKMVGLARHDVLLARDIPTEKVILVMPTWRQYLVGGAAHGTTRREASPDFLGSNYARAWRLLLRSDQLRRMAEHYGYRIVFFPHANMQLYVDAFEPPPWVEVKTHETEPILQKLYRRAAVIVTDYSSVFFEMGLLDKPVLYYQFDYDEMYGGKHPSRAGYFDFERDGFGPVARTEPALLKSLERVLEGGGRPAPEYLERMRATLPLRDGRNRERTVAAIEALESPEVHGSQQPQLRLAQARRASQRGQWALAHQLWGELATEAEHWAQASRALAEAARGLGRSDEAAERLAEIEEREGPSIWLSVQRAELASVTGTGAAEWEALREAELPEELGLAPGYATIRYAEALRKEGERDEARALLEALAESEPRAAQLALIAATEGDWNVALHLAGRVSRSVEPAELHLRLVEARRARAGAWHERPSDPRTRAELFEAEMAIDAAELKRARRQLEKLAKRGANGWTGGEILHFGQLVGTLGDLDLLAMARANSRRDLRLDAAAAEAWGVSENWRALAVDLDRSAVEDLEPTLRERARVWHARALVELGEPHRARAILGDRPDCGEHPGLTLATAARALQSAGQPDKALELWRDMLERCPNDAAEAAVHLARLLDSLGEREEANDLLRRHHRQRIFERLALDPDDLPALSSLDDGF